MHGEESHSGSHSLFVTGMVIFGGEVQLIEERMLIFVGRHLSKAMPRAVRRNGKPLRPENNFLRRYSRLLASAGFSK
jgi:hypothetical protein